jgi:hypothetical protein
LIGDAGVDVGLDDEVEAGVKRNLRFLGIVILRASKFKLLVIMKKSGLFGCNFTLEG